MFEVNSQTDFVAQNPEFLAVVDQIGITLIKDAHPSVETALKIKNSDGQSIEEMITSLRATLGEKIALRRLVEIQKESGQSYGVYLHTNRKIGAVVVTKGGNDQVARNVSMHVASMNPAYLDVNSVPSGDLEQLRQEIKDSPVLKSKPDQIKDQIAQGMLSKKLAELTLVDQEFVMEKMPVKTYLKNHNAEAKAMYRMEVGQGMIHKSCDFVSELVAMNAVDLIEKKRTGQKLTSSEIGHLVKGYVDGDLPDYQMAAFLMAVMFQGLDVLETSALTMAMARSGDVLDLSSVSGPVVDKHSTGGVGDKVSLIIGPVMASLGVSFAKMSGRGLGYTGGTADKLMSIPGYKINLSNSEFIRQVKEIKIALIGPSDNIVPADKKIYALRDVTATVESIALMTASVMSKKIATGADAILLDVKCGDGSFMKDVPAAKKLAELMIKIGQELGKNVRAEISNMSKPLGKAIGNRIEVLEAIQYLSGQAIPDLDELIRSSSQTLLRQARPSLSAEQARQQVDQVITSGRALNKFKE
ncbi:uncharacterized protein LOC111627211 [Centruroides sculpturatus]|uniref:uncharacterized protein LOC111615384 n=1 Tax=Centruroides sculpturatus TaxID=218467 RepID=UPI000C6CA587|nr:uncharacterized protein LOC111615384 [Centruroides sculpturatus]XP_023226549.1 uncharacterized protein LOC111627211 [Centruroides sculpturatus]